MAEPGRPHRIVGRIYANLGRLLGGKAAAGLLSLGYLGMASRSLGPADYGVLMLVHGYVMAVGAVVGIPGWHAVIRYGALALASEDQPRLASLLRLSAILEGVGGLLGIIAAAVFAPLVGPHLGWSPAAIALAVPYSFAVLATLRMTPTGYLQLAGRFDLISANYLVAPVVRLAGVLAALALHAHLRGFLVVWMASVVTEWAVVWAMGLMVAARRLPGETLMGPVGAAVAENPGFWKFLLAAKADVLLSDVPARLVLLTIGWGLGPAAAGLYSVAQRATVVFSQPAHILGQAAYSDLAGLAAVPGQGAAIRKALLHCVAIAGLVASPLLLLILVFAERLSMLMAGKGFRAAAPIMIWLAVARLIAMLSPPVSAALTALGRPGLSVIGNFATSLAFLLALPLMLRWWGLNGAGLNVVLQALACGLLLSWFILRETSSHVRAIPTGSAGLASTTPETRP